MRVGPAVPVGWRSFAEVRLKPDLLSEGDRFFVRLFAPPEEQKLSNPERGRLLQLRFWRRSS